MAVLIECTIEDVSGTTIFKTIEQVDLHDTACLQQQGHNEK